MHKPVGAGHKAPQSPTQPQAPPSTPLYQRRLTAILWVVKTEPKVTTIHGLPAEPLQPDDASRFVATRRFRDGVILDRQDCLAREEPLEIRVNGFSLAVTMRTPGDDQELVRGLLLSERIVERPAQIISIRHCTTVPDADADGNVIQARLDNSVHVDFDLRRRNLFVNSSCGVCGKASIEAAMATAAPLTDDYVFNTEVLASLPERLGQHQKLFRLTGGLHAAGIFSADGRMITVREDVGRHNAVDKAIGALSALITSRNQAIVLCVSGRASFEIVQKALALGIAVIVAVSAPTSLAVELAQSGGMTLIGFARGGNMNIYTHARRCRRRLPQHSTNAAENFVAKTA